jgi:tRNA(fMet)-specific endonuclease VapC
MMLYVLDTDTLTLFQHGHEGVLRNVQSHAPSELAVSVITVEEELRGWYTKLRRAKKRDQLARAYQHLTKAVSFFAKLQIISFTESAIDRYEQLRGSLGAIGKNDLRIAAIALEIGATVATRNVRDFRKFPS